jgi:alcohol dehydrogenase class IV
MDALSHAIESYTHNRANILTDLFAREAIVLIGRSLRTAVANGHDIEARYNMSIGSMYAGIALANLGGTGVHAMAHAVGGLFHVPHGVACGLLLPHAMEFNAPGNIPKFARIAEFLGEKADGLSLIDQAYQAAKAVKGLYRDLQVPRSLSELNVPKESIPAMSRSAFTLSRMIEGNPRAMAVEDVEELYRRCY